MYSRRKPAAIKSPNSKADNLKEEIGHGLARDPLCFAVEEAAPP